MRGCDILSSIDLDIYVCLRRLASPSDGGKSEIGLSQPARAVMYERYKFLGKSKVSGEEKAQSCNKLHSNSNIRYKGEVKPYIL